jgi:RHS repeat-associated protein
MFSKLNPLRFLIKNTATLTVEYYGALKNPCNDDPLLLNRKSRWDSINNANQNRFGLYLQFTHPIAITGPAHTPHFNFRFKLSPRFDLSIFIQTLYLKLHVITRPLFDYLPQPFWPNMLLGASTLLTENAKFCHGGLKHTEETDNDQRCRDSYSQTWRTFQESEESRHATSVQLFEEVTSNPFPSFTFNRLESRKRQGICVARRWRSGGKNKDKGAGWNTRLAAYVNYLRSLNIDEPFTRQSSTGNEHYHTDALGSSLSLSNGQGASVTTYIYEPFGKTTVTGTSTNAFQYNGRENDGTGLAYYQARYYSPILQRFISQDPHGMDGGLNFYAYTLNDPVNSIDPLGLASSSNRGPGRSGQGGSDIDHFGDIGEALNQGINLPFLGDLQKLDCARGPINDMLNQKNLYGQDVDLIYINGKLVDILPRGIGVICAPGVCEVVPYPAHPDPKSVPPLPLPGIRTPSLPSAPGISQPAVPGNKSGQPTLGKRK